MNDEVIRINCRKPNKLLTFVANFVKMFVCSKEAEQMANYQTTVTFAEETEDSEVVYEVVLTGYCGNDGGQSDIEGPTLYLIDGDEVEASEQTAEVQALFSDMEHNHFTDKRFAVKTEYPQPYSEYD